MKTLYIYDCIAGNLQVVQNLPAQIGNTPKCVCRLNMTGDAGIFMNTEAGMCTYFPQMGNGREVEVNGQKISGPYCMEDDKETLIAIGDGMFIAYLTAQPWQNVMAVFSGYDRNYWYILDVAKNLWTGPWPLEKCATPEILNLQDTRAIPVGAKKAAVIRLHKLHQIISQRKTCMPGIAPAIPTPVAMAPAPASVPTDIMPSYHEEAPPVNAGSAVQWDEDRAEEDVGRFTCPVCWLKFDPGDVMHIAVHPSLMGDEVLGRDKMKRFLAKRFNSRGQALDESGTPCLDMACPHCRSKLPPHFLDKRTHILSIIGAPSAGKSYYLASLIHEMGKVLMENNFPLGWKDADPSSNSMLNEVSNRLFNAATPETAYLMKTDLEGALYSEFYRHGRMVKLPKPFVYDLSSQEDTSINTSLIFYDNAGEHFEPGRNSEDSPGARHVAAADGLFFLFDPVSSPAFRRTIGEHSDPQLAHDAPMRMEQQNIIMAETVTRISTILNLAPGQRINTPLAIIIGKSDLWLDKLDGELSPIMRDGHIDQTAVMRNSMLLRGFLMHLHPSLCTTAESLSAHVRYFAASPLGCSPVKFFDETTGGSIIGPDPAQIAPRCVCDATLWALSHVEPQLVPSI